MIKFKIWSFTDKTGNFMADAIRNETLTNVQKLFDLAANYFNAVIASVDAEINVSLAVSSGIFSSAGPIFGWDSNTKEWYNEVEKAINFGKCPNNLDFSLTLTEAMLKVINNPNQVQKELTWNIPYRTILHEFGHALGVISYRSDTTGNLELPYGTKYDEFVLLEKGQPLFTGKFGSAIYGGNVPISPLGVPGTSISHIYSNGKEKVYDSLMVDQWPGFRPPSEYKYSDLDLAIFKDLGYKNLNTLTSFDGHRFIPGLKTSSIVGTPEVDLVLNDGARSAATLTQQNSNWLQTIGNQTISLQGIERLLFDNSQAVGLDLNGVAGQAYRIYQAAFDRKPDLAGLGFWIAQMDKGVSLKDVAGGFLASDEFRKLYGAAPSNTDFLSALYKNVLHRSPDGDGYNWWLARLTEGVARQDVLASFSESPENQAQVIGQIEHGIDYLIWP